MAEITIILSTYNRRALLPMALKSIVAQTFSAWRLLVINDGGEDVGDVVASFNDARMEYYNRPHLGKAAQMNYALDLVQSKYIVYMDDDDEALPHHLQTLYAAAEENNVEFAYSNLRQIILTSDGKQISESVLGEGCDVKFEDIRLYNQINHAVIIHTKALAERVGKYDERMRILIDYDYIRRLAKVVPPFHINEITYVHYLRTKVGEDDFSSISGLWHSDPVACGRSILAMFERDPEAIANIYYSLPQSWAEKGKLQQQLDAKNSELNQCITNYNKLKVERDCLSADRDAIAADRNAISTDRDAIAAAYDEMRNSTCWRMTKPLRWVLDKLKGLIRG